VGIFELIVQEAPQVAATVREVRSRSSPAVAEIVGRIGSVDPVSVVDTTDFPVEMESLAGYRSRHDHCLEAYEALIKLGDTVLIQYRPSADWEPELVDLAMARNPMASELASTSQDHH